MTRLRVAQIRQFAAFVSLGRNGYADAIVLIDVFGRRVTFRLFLLSGTATADFGPVAGNFSVAGGLKGQ